MSLRSLESELTEKKSYVGGVEVRGAPVTQGLQGGIILWWELIDLGSGPQLWTQKLEVIWWI